MHESEVRSEKEIETNKQKIRPSLVKCSHILEMKKIKLKTEIENELNVKRKEKKKAEETDFKEVKETS